MTDKLPPLLTDSIWVSLDPRDHQRLVQVEAVSDAFAFVRPYGNATNRRRSRIHVSRFDGRQWKQMPKEWK